MLRSTRGVTRFDPIRSDNIRDRYGVATDEEKFRNASVMVWTYNGKRQKGRPKQRCLIHWMVIEDPATPFRSSLSPNKMTQPSTNTEEETKTEDNTLLINSIFCNPILSFIIKL